MGFNSCEINGFVGSYENSKNSAPSLLSKEKEYLTHKLFKAIVEGDLQELDALADMQLNFGLQDFDKRTPL